MGQTEITCAAGTIVGEMRDGARVFDAIPYLAPGGAFDDPEPLEQGLLLDATTPQPYPLSISAPLRARPGTDCPVIMWLSDPVDPFDGFVHVHVPHRTGFEGFLPFAADAPGHFRGVADVKVALRWIQRNIEAFGGDPTNVTVVGEGEEAAVALWLCRRDHYAGEFRRVWAANPEFPRTPYEKRKWFVRYLLSAPLTRDRLNQLAEERPGRVGRSYRRYAKFFGPMGPQPYDATEQATLAHARIERTVDAPAIADFAR